MIARYKGFVILIKKDLDRTNEFLYKVIRESDNWIFASGTTCPDTVLKMIDLLKMSIDDFVFQESASIIT